jgi:hypothetical protein
MASADESSPARLRRRFQDNDLSLPPGLLDLLREALERQQLIGEDDLPDPYFGPDWRVTVTTHGPDKAMTGSICYIFQRQFFSGRPRGAGSRSATLKGS